MSVDDYGQRAHIDGKFPIDYELSGNPDSKSLIIFFHGYGQHFGFMKKSSPRFLGMPNIYLLMGLPTST